MITGSMLTNLPVLNMKALVSAFNQEKALVGAFSVIVKLRVIFSNLGFKLYSCARTLQSTRLRLARTTLMLTSGGDGEDWKKSAEVVLYIF